MYENHRKSFYRGDRREFDDDRFAEERWRDDERTGWDPYRGRPSHAEADRAEWAARRRRGYAGASRDDDRNRYSGYGPDGAPEYWRSAGRDSGGHWAHDARHGRYGQGAASYGYGAGQPYGGGEGDSRYFTGQQGSWAVGSPYGAHGSQQFGADYRPHSYSPGGYDDDDRGFWDRASDEVASWFGDEGAARRRELDHRGRGPKDYVRSDERIREDANDRLTDDARVDASNVTLTVEGGEVTLNGTVASRGAKRRAEDLIDEISGVKHVQNNLRVAEGAATAGTPRSNWTLNPAPNAEGGTIAEPGTQTAPHAGKI
jgi:osmotically-inducible protein OsmY